MPHSIYALMALSHRLGRLLLEALRDLHKLGAFIVAM